MTNSALHFQWEIAWNNLIVSRMKR